MWMECISDRAYRSREHLAEDVVRVLREELHFLLAAGASLVQLDEPVLTEVVFTGAKSTPQLHVRRAQREGRRRRPSSRFAQALLAEVVGRACRASASRCTSAAATGRATSARRWRATTGRCCRSSRRFAGRHALPRARARRAPARSTSCATLPRPIRIGVGVVNQKHDAVEPPSRRSSRAHGAPSSSFGAERVLLTPDCGFATFADNPVASARVAEAKLRAIARAAAILAGRGPDQQAARWQ